MSILYKADMPSCNKLHEELPQFICFAISTNGNHTNKVPFVVKHPTLESNLMSMRKSYCSVYLHKFRPTLDGMFDHGFTRYRTLKNTCQSHSRVKLSQTLWELTEDSRQRAGDIQSKIRKNALIQKRNQYLKRFQN